MKKKMIEQMPAPRITKNMEDIVVIARNPAAGLLTLDVVEAVTKEVMVRICVTENEFANYYPDTGTWDNKQIDGILTYVTTGNGQIIYYDLYGKSNIQKVLGKKYDSVLAVLSYEYELAQEKRRVKEWRRAERCKQRNNRVPEPNAKMKEWLDRYVDGIHYIYYKREGKYAQIACSACRKAGKYIMIPETYEDFTKKNLGFKPEHNMGGQPCPICGIYGLWKAAGRTTGVWAQKDRRYVVDKVDGTVVVRYFEIEKMIQGNELSAEEYIAQVEVARNWFINGKLQKDYYKYDPYTGDNFWDDRNLAGMANIQQKAGKVCLKEENILDNTPFKYSGLEQEILRNDYTDAVRYLSVYLRWPMIEILEKLGMTKLRSEILEGWGSENWLNKKGRNAQDILKITKQRFRDLKDKNGDKSLLGIYQYECEHNVRFKDEVIELLYFCGADKNRIAIIMQHATLGKVLHYVLKQAGIKQEYISQHSERARQELQRYVDYLGMLEQNGRQFTEHELYPANLEVAHNREVTLRNKKKGEEEIEKKNKSNPNIKKDAAGYNRKYRYQNKDYIIRAPKNAGEIFMEGLQLNHCVGRMGYIEAMNRHETVILFLREKKNKDAPYYTLEIKNEDIVQAYGYGDRKPDWEKVQPFLNAFKEAKLRENGSERKAG